MKIEITLNPDFSVHSQLNALSNFIEANKVTKKIDGVLAPYQVYELHIANDIAHKLTSDDGQLFYADYHRTKNNTHKFKLRQRIL